VVAKGTIRWRLTVSADNDSSGGFSKAMEENSTSIVQDILNIFADSGQCKEKGCFVGLGYLDVIVLETDVGRECSRGGQ
jgi:hypothetical protein